VDIFSTDVDSVLEMDWTVAILGCFVIDRGG